MQTKLAAMDGFGNGLAGAEAQTFPQLFNQLQGQGFSPADLDTFHRAYELALDLSACQYRSSGRTLIDHTIGMTSIVAAVGGGAPLVSAALLHNGYLHGDFGTALKRITAAKRKMLRDVAGVEAEELVYRYSALSWRTPAIALLGGTLPSLSRVDRQVVLMRLADQLDVFGTRDALYCNNVPHRRAFAREVGPVIASMARELGYPELELALARAFKTVAHGQISAAVANPAGRDGVILMASYRTRLPIAAYRSLRYRLWRWTGW